MNDYVSKPISPQALADALDKWLPQDTAARKEKVPAKAHVHTPATPGTAGAPVFDKSDIIARMDNDEDLAREVIVGFLDDIPRQISALRGYLEAGDTVRVERQAHTIKGASASVGGEALRVVAFEMEKAGKAGELEVITASLPELEAQFARLKVAMNEFIMQGGIYGKNTDYR
jgi:HPt (histidine-containing phosphotransfer) domain-containing protein